MSALTSTFTLTHSLYARSDADYDSVVAAYSMLFDQIVTSKYFVVGLTTALVYHWILTMDKEIKHFWSKPTNLISLVYFANRWIGLLGSICNILYHGFRESLTRVEIWMGTLAGMLTIVLIDYILLVRVLALYNQDRRLAICLGTLLALEFAADLSLLVYANLFQTITYANLDEHTAVCGFMKAAPRSLAIISWAIPMAYGLLLLILALYKAAEYWRLSAGFKGFGLVTVLIQDQVLYFGFVIFCCAFKIAYNFFVVSNPILASFLSSVGSPTVLCILGSHLLINLKEAAERGFNGGTNYHRSKSVSGIDFA